MTQHHRTGAWTAVSRKLRPIIQARLPEPCTKCGWPVYAEHAWQIDHIVAVSQGGSDDWSNLGPAHKRCNQSDGGKLGAAMTNSRRRVKREYPY